MTRIYELENTNDESETMEIRVFDKVYQYMFSRGGRVYRRLLSDDGPVREWEELAAKEEKKGKAMKPLREWIEGEVKRVEAKPQYTEGQQAFHFGYVSGLRSVQLEVQGREDAEQVDETIEGARIREVPLLYEDARPIAAIYWESEAGAEHAVGRSGVTKILSYLDNTTLWFAVYQGDFLSRRVPAYEVCVLYANSGEKL